MKTLVVIFLAIITFSCDNDDPSTPAPNANVCNYAGLTYVDNANNTNIAIPEADLTTDFFPNNSGTGIPAVEIWGTAPTGEFVVFVTDAVTNGATEVLTTSSVGHILVNGTNLYGTVTCQRGGTAVGDEFRFDVALASGGELEYCVVIDSVTP